MVDEEFYASEDSKVHNCDPCQFENIQKEAGAFCYDCNEYLCQQCLQFHRKFQAFRQHHILRGDSIPTARKVTNQKLTLKLCDNHRMNEVEFYCSYHKCVLCSICKVATHSKCNCKLIDELVSVNEDQSKFDNIVKKIEVIKTSFEQHRAEQITNIDSTAVDSKINREQLDSARKEMNLFFDRLANAIDEREKKVQAYTKELKGEVQMCTDVVNYVTSLKENIQDVSQSNDKIAIFSANCKLEKIAKEYATLKDNIFPLQKPEQSNYVTQTLIKVKEIYEPSDDKEKTKSSTDIYVHNERNVHDDTGENISTENELDMTAFTSKESNDKKESRIYNPWGHIEDTVIKADNQYETLNNNSCNAITDSKRESDIFENKSSSTGILGRQNMPFSNLNPGLVSFLRVTDETDDSACDITGSLFLPDGSLILCNHGGSKVILLDRNFKMQDQLRFVGNVWDVALLDKTVIIVTMKHKKELKFIQVLSGKLYEKNRINLKMVPWGIAVYKQYIFITFHNNPGNGFIEVRDTSGRIIRTIAKSKTGEELFDSPYYVAVNQLNGNIYVTDGRKHSLVCLSISGEHLYTVHSEKLKWPRKIILDDYGNCILCASLANKVIQIQIKEKRGATSNVRYHDMKVLFQECHRPQTVSMRWEDQTMILGINKTNKIQVVKFMFTK